MSSRFALIYKGFLLALVAPVLLSAQITTINVGNTVLQNGVKRFGINLGAQAFYDSGQLMKNLVFTNPSFEGEIYQSTVRCGSGTANSCTDENIYSGWTPSFWRNASYEMISGASVGRSGSICSFTGALYPNGAVFTFCDSGTAPAPGDYMVVKITMPPNVGWPSGDWQTVVGNGSLGVETYDLPPGTTGKQSALLTAPTASDSIALNTFFDSTKNKTFLQLNGSYQLTFKAKGVAGTKSLAIKLDRADAGLTYINQTLPLSGAWAPYTLNFNASEGGSAIGRVELTFATVGADTVELDDISLVQTNTDPTNTTVFRDEVVTALQALHPGVLRLWEDQLGESLDNLLADPQGRQRSGYTPYGGYDATDVNFQTQGVKFGLTEFLQLCQKVGADPWIVVPSTFSTSEAYNLIDYLSGPSTTPYGAKRAAAGQSQPWSSVFKQIHLEFGNEAWNGGTFKGGALEYGDSYGGRATAIFTAMRGNGNYSAPSFDLIVNGQSAAPYRNQNIQSHTMNNDSFSIAPYMMYNITQFDTIDHLFGTTFAEAEAFVSNATAEGVVGGYITQEQQLVGKPIVTSEMNLSPSGGTMTQAVLDGYASSVGGGLAVLDSMFLQLRAGVMTQNLFELPGYISSTVQSPANNMYLWGAVVDMGVTNRKRPQYLALQLANSAIGSATQMLQTAHTGADPTDNQYNYGLNSVSLPTFHFLQSFAFTGGGSTSLVVFNVNPDYAEQVNFAGANAPTGSVVMQRLTSANITDTNELANVVGITSTTIPNFNAGSTMTLPPYSMTVFTWGGTTQPAPMISNVASSAITSTSATITWTTDQPATSQVAYGTSLSYGILTSVNNTLSTSHTVVLTGLTPGTAYNFQAISANNSNVSTPSANYTFATLAAAKPVISNVATSAITSTSVTIAWTTDQAATSQVEYGTTTAYGTLSPNNPTLSTSHSVTLSGLTAGTNYNFALISANSSNASTTSGNYTFATLAAASPLITNVQTSELNSTSVTITWTTDQSATSQVSYGMTTAYGTLSPKDITLSTTHSVNLSGLTPGTSYNFAVISANSSNASTTSGNFTFATSAAPSPLISAVASSAITSTSATINWTTDQAATSQVSYGTTTGYGLLSPNNTALSTSHSITLTGLTPGTTYNFAVISANSSNASATSGNFTFATTAAAAPLISNVAASGLGSTSATITWTTDQPASSLVDYGTTPGYGSMSALNPALVTSHSVTLTGLAANTTYNFAVVSANSSNKSATSGNGTFGTTAGTPPQIGYLAYWGINNSGVTVSWSTDLPANTQLAYGTSTALGQLSPLQPALAASHGVVLTGLNSGTTYYFVAQSTGANGATGYSTTYSFTTTGVAVTPPPLISNIASTGITNTSATITWNTDQAASSQVAYGTTTGYGSLSANNPALSTAHSVTLTGLAPGTTYDFAVTSANSGGVSATSTNASFTTSGTVAPPGISNVATTGITSTSVTITWTTDQAASSLVNYGTTTGYGSMSTLNSALVTSHSVTLTGLTPGTTYDFDVVSVNGGGAPNTSGNGTFTTTKSTGTPPQVGYLAYWGINNSSITISWSTDVLATTQLAYGTTTALGQLTPLQTTLAASHGVVLTGLNSGTTYYFVAQSTAANGATGYSPVVTFTTTGTPTPGPFISGVTATGISSSSATITWTTDQAASSQVFYGATTSSGSQSPLNTALVTSHSVTLTGLAAGTTYNFNVVSANAGGTSSTSANATFTTTAGSVGPPLISNVLATAIGNTSATITWTTDQAASSLVNYGLTPSYGSASAPNASLVTSHSVTLIGLSAGTTYNFNVVSANAASQSNPSGNLTFTTTNTSVPGPNLNAVAFWGVTGSGATIGWSTDQLSDTAVEYGTTAAFGQTTPVQPTLANSHGVVLTNLNGGTTYYFRARSTSAAGGIGYSSTYSFTTLDVSGPVISNIVATPTSANAASVSWTVNKAATTQVEYGSDTSYGRWSLQTTGTQTPLGWVPSGTVHFRIHSSDVYGNQTVTPDSTFSEP